MVGNVILLAGIHGVGKSFFSETLSCKFGVDKYVASKLISDKIKVDYNRNKKVTNIQENQNVLKVAMQEKGLFEKTIILEGHFCLLNKFGEVEKIPFQTFQELNLKAIIVLREEPRIIRERLFDRGNDNYNVEFLNIFQETEIAYANEVASKLNIPLFIENSLSIDLNKFKTVF